VRRFIKRELLQEITPFKLTKLDIDDQKNYFSASLTDIGLGADSVIKVVHCYFISFLLLSTMWKFAFGLIKSTINQTNKQQQKQQQEQQH